MTTRSVQPSRYPANNPKSEPMTAPTKTEMKPAAREIRVPAMIRLKMSRPSASTPNQCLADGPAFSAS